MWSLINFEVSLSEDNVPAFSQIGKTGTKTQYPITFEEESFSSQSCIDESAS